MLSACLLSQGTPKQILVSHVRGTPSSEALETTILSFEKAVAGCPCLRFGFWGSQNLLFSHPGTAGEVERSSTHKIWSQHIWVARLGGTLFWLALKGNPKEKLPPAILGVPPEKTHPFGQLPRQLSWMGNSRDSDRAYILQPEPTCQLGPAWLRESGHMERGRHARSDSEAPTIMERIS